MDKYHVKFIDFNRPPRPDAGRFSPLDEYCHIIVFEALNDDDAENKAMKLIEGSDGPFAILWNGQRQVKALKDRHGRIVRPKKTFTLSEQKFKDIVNKFYSSLGIGTEPVGATVDYLQKFVVGIEDRDIIGPCDYELQVGDYSILLNNPASKAELGTLVIKVLVF